MTKRAAVPVLALAALLLLTGCGPANAGSAGVRDFHEYMDDVPGVAEVQASGSNDLPFTGSARATVVLDDGADDDTLTAVVGRMADYLDDHPYSVSWSMVAELDGFTLAVAADDGDNADAIALLGDVRAVDGVVGGSIGTTSSLVVADPAAFITTLEQLVELDFRGSVQASDADGTFSVTSTDDTELPADAIAAYDAIAAAYAVTTAQLVPGGLTLRVASDSDATAARALAESLPTSSGMVFAITGGIVTREGEGDFTRVDAIIVSAEAVPDVVGISARPDTLGFTVTTLDAVAALQTLVTAGDPASTLTVYYVSADGTTPEFRLYGAAERRAAFLPIVRSALEAGYIEQFEVSADRIDVVAGAYDESRMAQLAATLKSLLPEGTPVRLTNSTGGVNFSFVSGDSIDVPSDESYGDVDAQGFVDAWNAAVAP